MYPGVHPKMPSLLQLYVRSMVGFDGTLFVEILLLALYADQTKAAKPLLQILSNHFYHLPSVEVMLIFYNFALILLILIVHSFYLFFVFTAHRC